jgi:hypothetical protein
VEEVACLLMSANFDSAYLLQICLPDNKLYVCLRNHIAQSHDDSVVDKISKVNGFPGKNMKMRRLTRYR